jgi:predicted metal-dependent hydrolase
MRRKQSPNFLAGYSAALTGQVHALIEQEKLSGWLLKKYPLAHDVRTDRALYLYIIDYKDKYFKNAGPLSRVAFDGKLQDMRNALGMHTSVSRVQGANLKSRREILVANVFKDMPQEFLRMIVAHELAHLKENEHNKAFYQLCLHMEPDYHQLEFDLRVYLTWLAAGKPPLW